MARMELAADVRQLRESIARWKAAHGRRARMPLELWALALRFAGQVGAYGASRALGVSYDSLKRRAALPSPRRGEDFVELDARDVLAPTGNIIVELSRRDGSRMTVRVGQQPLDVSAVVAGFCGRSK